VNTAQGALREALKKEDSEGHKRISRKMPTTCSRASRPSKRRATKQINGCALGHPQAGRAGAQGEGETTVKHARFPGTKKPAVPETKQPDEPQEVLQDPQARLRFREELRRDKEEAMAEYLTQQEATRKKTELLKTAREAREAKLKRAGKAKAKQ
jgi:hypothetical protein